MPIIHGVPNAAPYWDQVAMMMGLTKIRSDIPMVKYVSEILHPRLTAYSATRPLSV